MTDFLTHAERAYEYFQRRQIQEAIREFRLGLQAGEDPNAAALERWLSFMMAGEFELAWQESDRVMRQRQESGAQCAHLPQHQRWLWDGAPLVGRRVLVRCFHGLGDTIQFARFLPQLRAICESVAFRPQAELTGLMPPLEADDADLEIELMEVPHALRATLGTIPASVPYLTVPGAGLARSTKFRVGLAWASGIWRPERSVPLELFGFLNSVPGLELVGLQRGPAALHLPPASPVFHEADWGNTSVVDTARIIRSLDLVITTDTMVAHLAGALAAPVWTLLHWDSDWRWLNDRDDSPWYPTMRLFRQREPGNWAEVLERVRHLLTAQQKQIGHNQGKTRSDANCTQAS